MLTSKPPWAISEACLGHSMDCRQRKTRACCSPRRRGFSLTCSNGHGEGIPTSHHSDLHRLEPHNQVGYPAVAAGVGAQLPVLVAPKGVTLARS